MRGEGYVFKRGRVWYFENKSLGIKAESANTEDKKEAQRQLRCRNNEIRAGLSPDSTKVKLAELIRDKLAAMKMNKNTSLRNAKTRATTHILPYFGEAKWKDITTGRVNDFINYRHNQGASNSEINRETELIRASGNLGKRNQKIQIVPYIPRLDEPSARSGFFERKQLETLLTHLPQSIAQLIHFYYITGWRHNEGMNLLWSSVSFETRRIVLPGDQTKNGLPRVFPFTPELEALLSEQREYTDRIQRDHYTLHGVVYMVKHVFHRSGNPIHDFRKDWDNACEAAGLVGAIVHSFRRTAVRNLELAGVPRKVAMQMVGMETDSIYNRYRIVAEGELQDAADAMAVFEQKQKGGAK